MATDNHFEINKDNFEQLVLKATKPIVVDFYADWCGPCRIIAPFLEEIAAELPEDISVAKINIDQNVEIAKKYEITGIPAIFLFKNGQKVAAKIGSDSKANILKWINENR